MSNSVHWSNISDHLKVGDVIRCQIFKIESAYVAVWVYPGIHGLIPQTEWGWDLVADPKTVFKPRQILDLKVINMRPEEKHIGLSYRLMQEDPWEKTKNRFPLGEEISGKVKMVRKKAVGIIFDDGVEGTISARETPEIIKKCSAIGVGNKLPVVVLGYNNVTRKIELGIPS